MFDKDNKFGFIINNNNNNSNNSDIKKYVDDKITIKTLPVDVNKNYCTNVADLEENSIYMSPNDAKFLYLAYEKLSGTIVGFCFSAKPHGRFIYTGYKDDSRIEIMIEGSCYTVYFKTDTEDGHVEKTVYYLTKNNTIEYTPTADYNPATKKYVDDNTVMHPLPIHHTQETTGSIIKFVNIMDLIPGVQYSTYKDINQTKTEGYRVVYVCDDGTFKTICTLPLKNKTVHLLKAVHYTNYSTLSYNNTGYKVDYSKQSTNTDIEVTRTLQNYLPIANTIEYNPARDYHPTTKKYVDDKFICTDIVENVGTISKEEMQKCNDGTSRYVSSIKFEEFFADYEHCIYQGMYGDKKIRMKYDKEYNRIIADDFSDVISLGFDFGTHYMYPFNAATDEVKTYQFTNDLVITKSPRLNPSEIYSKGLREYVGTKENPVLFTEMKNGWNIVKNYYKWYAEYENSIPCGTMLVHKHPLGNNFYITYMNGTELTRYGYNATTHVIKGYKHVLNNEVLTKNNTIEYTPTENYHPTTKKYVDDKVSSLPQFSFNENGELVVKIGDTTKIFVPKE